MPYPILIKPRMHAHRIRNDKGVVYPKRIDQTISGLQPLVDVAKQGSSQSLVH
jgi:hypothetical protein